MAGSASVRPIGRSAFPYEGDWRFRHKYSLHILWRCNQVCLDWSKRFCSPADRKSTRCIHIPVLATSRTGSFLSGSRYPSCGIRTPRRAYATTAVYVRDRCPANCKQNRSFGRPQIRPAQLLRVAVIQANVEAARYRTDHQSPTLASEVPHIAESHPALSVPV